MFIETGASSIVNAADGARGLAHGRARTREINGQLMFMNIHHVYTFILVGNRASINDECGFLRKSHLGPERQAAVIGRSSHSKVAWGSTGSGSTAAVRPAAVTTAAIRKRHAESRQSASGPQAAIQGLQCTCPKAGLEFEPLIVADFLDPLPTRKCF
jgi:hypothetical protein